MFCVFYILDHFFHSLSVESGLFRLKPKSGFLTQSTEDFLDSTFFGRVFRLGDPVEKLDFFDWICQSKNSVEKVYTCFLNPSHRSSNRKTQNTHPHTHTPIPSTIQQYNSSAPTLAWLSLLLLLAASQRGALLAPLASSVYHTTTAARAIHAILPTKATPAVVLVALG